MTRKIEEQTEPKPIKHSEVTIAFAVRPEYIAKNTADPGKWSTIVFFIVLIVGPIAVIFSPDADIWGFVAACVIFPVFIYFMIVYYNFKSREIYLLINDKSLVFYGGMISEIKFSKLEKIELIRDCKNEQILMIKFYTTNIFMNGGGLTSEMFDLEAIYHELKNLKSISRNIWTERTIIVRKKHHGLILFSILFLLIIICIFLYLSGNL